MTSNIISRDGTRRLLVTNTDMDIGMIVTAVLCTRQTCLSHKQYDNRGNGIKSELSWR